jgi:hypothetical protein
LRTAANFLQKSLHSGRLVDSLAAQMITKRKYDPFHEPPVGIGGSHEAQVLDLTPDFSEFSAVGSAPSPVTMSTIRNRLDKRVSSHPNACIYVQNATKIDANSKNLRLAV